MAVCFPIYLLMFPVIDGEEVLTKRGAFLGCLAQDGEKGTDIPALPPFSCLLDPKVYLYFSSKVHLLRPAKF